MAIPAPTKFTGLTVTDLAAFSGRPEAGYTDFAATAIEQAVTLFQLATCLDDWPSDPDQQRLAMYGVLDMADKLTIAQPYALTTGTPFQSESIGSYSYSKGRSFGQVQKTVELGLPTGAYWFDIAVQRLGVCELGGLNGGGVDSGSIGVFERDATFGVLDGDDSGKRYVLGPNDVNTVDDEPFFVSQNITPDARKM
jgi:hypothetical protein